MTVPLSISASLVAGNFTALAGAVIQAGLLETLEGLSDVTIFAPNNDAFQAIAGAAVVTTAEQLTQILQLHVVQGTVAYSTTLQNSSIETIGGGKVNITIIDGAVFVNTARVINSDVLIANGVLHVIDSVLNPGVFNGPIDVDGPPSVEYPIGPLPEVPFTSGVEPETSIYSQLSGTTSSVAAGLAAPTPNASASAGNGSASSNGSLSGGSPTSTEVMMQTGNAAAKDGLHAAVAVLMGAAAVAAGI